MSPEVPFAAALFTDIPVGGMCDQRPTKMLATLRTISMKPKLGEVIPEQFEPKVRHLHIRSLGGSE